MKKYKTLKGLAITFMVFTLLTLLLTVAFYNITELEFVANIIRQLGESFTSNEFVLTDEITFACQKWALVASCILFFLTFVFTASAFTQAETVVTAVKYSQKAVIQTFTNSKKDRLRLQKKQMRDQKMKLREERKAAKLAKKAQKLQLKEAAEKAKLAKKEEKAAKAVAKKEKPVEKVNAAPTVQQTQASAKQQRIDDILNSLK